MGYINIPGAGGNGWQSPVATSTDLPAVGNTAGDARIAIDSNTIYIWSGSAWVAESDTIVWGGIGGTLSNQTDLQNALNTKVTLAGTAGGQTVIGGTAASNNLTLQSTSNATRGNIIHSDRALFADGTVALPGIAYTSDPDSGFYALGSNDIGIANGGVKNFTFSSGGDLISNQGVGTDRGIKWIPAAGTGNSAEVVWGDFGVPGISVMSFRTTATVGDAQFRFFDGATTKAYIVGGTTPYIQTVGHFTTSGSAHPASTADEVRIGGFDISAGNRTLSFSTETAVAVDVALVSTHSLIVYHNGTKYKLALTAV